MDTEARLTAYIDGELTQAETAHLETELQTDAGLRAQLRALQDTMALVRDHGRVRAPVDFHERVMAATEELAVPVALSDWKRRPFGVPIQLVALAALAILVVLVALPDPPTTLPTAPATQLQIPQSTAPVESGSSIDVVPSEEAPEANDVPRDDVGGMFMGHVPTGGLMLTTTDSDVLSRLLSQRETLGIEVLDERGARLKNSELDERTTLWIEVPVQRYKAVEQALSDMGQLRKGTEEMVGGNVSISLQIHLQKAYPMHPILPD
jgi:hypothetical protein